MYVPVVTLNTENNNKLANLLSEGFERLVTWNEYKRKIDTVTTPTGTAVISSTKRILLDSSFQGVSRLFVMSFNNALSKEIVMMSIYTEENRIEIKD